MGDNEAVPTGGGESTLRYHTEPIEINYYLGPHVNTNVYKANSKVIRGNARGDKHLP